MNEWKRDYTVQAHKNCIGPSFFFLLTRPNSEFPMKPDTSKILSASRLCIAILFLPLSAWTRHAINEFPWTMRLRGFQQQQKRKIIHTEYKKELHGLHRALLPVRINNFSRTYCTKIDLHWTCRHPQKQQINIYQFKESRHTTYWKWNGAFYNSLVHRFRLLCRKD